ncbi:MAG: hypothetical protein IPP93_18630 [Chitinophagaceae bacterium]|nr:hypothetical protein [Chitinophagaceae bacterium]
MLHIDKKGYLWAGTRDNGLFRITYSVLNDKIDITVKDYSYLLPDKSVRSIFEDSHGDIWVGTRYQGVCRLTSKDNDEYDVMSIGMSQGMTSDWIRSIAEDADHSMWIGSVMGIDKLIPEDNGYRVFNFSRANNFFASINSILPQQDHSLWVTSDKGLVHIIDGATERSVPFPVYITAVNLGDTSFKYKAYHKGASFKLKYNQNQAAFEFSSPGFINEKQVLYSYRLVGSGDTVWSKGSNLHNVSYASLKPGSYRFEVRTTGWNEEIGLLRF